MSLFYWLNMEQMSMPEMGYAPLLFHLMTYMQYFITLTTKSISPQKFIQCMHVMTWLDQVTVAEPHTVYIIGSNDAVAFRCKEE